MISKKQSDKLFFSTLIASVAAAPLQAEASFPINEQIDQPAYPKHHSYRYGYVGPSIKYLQNELSLQGYYQDKIDGKFGPHTQAAVIQFQLEHSIKTDGIAGAETLNKLYKDQDEKKMEQPKPPILLQVGDKGPKITEIQKKLKALDYYHYKVDGIYGKITYSAVERFQKNNKLKVDGIVGTETYKALQSETAVGNEPSKVKVNKSHSVKTHIISYAKNMIGVPYEWGGITPSGFDCSGFIKYVFNQRGYTIPRTVNELWNFGVSVTKPSIGDIVFFQTYKPGPSHAGIYMGNGKFIHAGSNGVKVSNLNISYWQKRFIGTKRVVQL